MSKTMLNGFFAMLFVWVISITGASARDYISIVGSSTVFPYTQAVAEEFAAQGKKAPVVESTGTGGGFKIFCGGVGTEFPDITGASRAVKDKEVKLCKSNNVGNILEVRLGSDGIVIAAARGGTSIDLTLEGLYLAFAKNVPLGNGGSMIANPHKTWKDVGDSLNKMGKGSFSYPATVIRAFGPPPTSGTRDAFVELAMFEGCMSFDANKSVKKADRGNVCGLIRNDGAYIDSGENDNLIIQRLTADKDAVGIFGYSFLYENPDKIVGMKVNNVSPSLDTIGDGSYPIARPLFIYIKETHLSVIPGIKDFLTEYLSEEALSEDGYLVERGLIVPSKSDRDALRSKVLGN